MKFDAAEFLDGLFRSSTTEDDYRAATIRRRLIAIRKPTDLPPEWWVAWDERAAIMEYEGNRPREEAEARALDEIIRNMRAAMEAGDPLIG